MVYGYLLLGCFLAGTAVWTTKYYLEGNTYGGNGWWSPYGFFGFPSGSFPGSEDIGWHPGDTDEGLPKDIEAWLNWWPSFGKDFGDFKGFFFNDLTTDRYWGTTHETDILRIDTTHHKGHLRPPAGGWGIDYEPYVYHPG